MDRRQFFGAVRVIIVGTPFPGRGALRLPYEAPKLTPLGRLDPDELQRLNTALPRYDGYRRFSPFEFEVTAP